jgi:hypothetical protein
LARSQASSRSYWLALVGSLLQARVGREIKSKKANLPSYHEDFGDDDDDDDDNDDDDDDYN